MVSQLTRDRVQKIQDIIGQDDGGRGMKSLIVPNDLLHAAIHITSLVSNKSKSDTKSKSKAQKQKHVIILSGFPCCVNENPPTETDGPPGTVAIAKCMLALGFDSVTIVVDECNESVFQAAIQETHDIEFVPQKTTDDSTCSSNNNRGKRIQLVIFPPEQGMKQEDYDRMQSMVDEACDLLIACERAGPGASGNCYTMRGIDMTSMNLIAPLHKMVDMVRTKNQNKHESDGDCNHHDYADHDDHYHRSDHNDHHANVQFIAIGDGGNELGMGKVIDKILTNPKISNGDLIGAVTPADYLIAASVSNWGGYALAAACALVKCDRDDDDAGNDAGNDDGDHIEAGSCDDGKKSIEDWVKVCVPSTEHEIALLDRCVAAGCRDGVSGKMEATVDGMPLETSLNCLQSIKDACLGVGRGGEGGDNTRNSHDKIRMTS